MRSLPAACPDGESIEALVCRARPVDSPVALYIVPKPGSFFDPEYTTGYGSSHGSPYLNDRTVPLLVRAPKRVAAGRVVDEPQSYTRYRGFIDELANSR